MFDVAIYTDTRASEAVDGIDGFNFQALSEGMTAQDRQVIRDHMLHRVVVGWNVDHDPLAHPPSFAYYAHAGRYYLSRGVSTGVTNNGRPGNLLTEAIATSDPDDFGTMRPAQLLGALNWRLEKAPGKTIGRWAAPLEVAPGFEADALRDMVRGDAWAVAHFAEFLAMVEQVTAPTPKRLVLITADEVLARKWIALGTLFVEAGRSLALTIRGLVQDPMTTKADIVAASPEFGAQPDPGTPRAGVNVVDLDRRAIGPITATESALTQADWFLSEDSAAALAAIDVARRWEEFLGRDLATRAAAIASFPKDRADHGDWLTAMEALRGLADGRQDDELFFYGDSLMDAAITCAPGAPEDAELAGAAVVALLGAGSQDLAAGVLMQALESVCGTPRAREALLSALAAAPARARLVWEDGDARARASLLLSRVAEEAEDALLPALLSAVRTLGAPIADPARPGVVARMARLWASSPDLTAQCERWEHGGEIIEELVRVLVDRWRRGGEGDLRALVGGTWAWLASSPALPPPARALVEQWNAAARLARLPVPERSARLRTAGRIPPDSWRLMWNRAELPADCGFFTVWAQTQSKLVREAGGWILDRVSASLATGRPAVDLRELLIRLDQSGIEVRDEGLRTYAAQVSSAAGYFRAAVRSSSDPNPYLPAVTACVPAMSALMVDYLGEIILTCRDERGVSRLVAADEAWAREAVRHFLTARGNTAQGMADAITWAAGTLHGRLSAPAQGAQDFLLEVCDDRKRAALVGRAAKERLVDQWALAVFEDFAKDAKKGRFTRRLSRAASGLLNGKGRDS